MKLLTFISFLTLITYISAVPQPDTNIQIQHYDGPVYLGTPPPSCCPFCNSIIKPEGKECETPEICPQVYENTYEGEPHGITISLDAKDPTPACEKDRIALGKINLGAESCKSMLHTSIHNIPVTCKNYGNTWSPFGTSPCMECKPLSNYLPINTACQNTCQVPILTYNGNSGACNSDEPVLVPQKFMYSLILDGQVGTNQNGCDSRLYYY